MRVYVKNSKRNTVSFYANGNIGLSKVFRQYVAKKYFSVGYENNVLYLLESDSKVGSKVTCTKTFCGFRIKSALEHFELTNLIGKTLDAAWNEEKRWIEIPLKKHRK